MNVVAISTPRSTDWRWRIVNYSGEVVEESHAGFPSISSAIAEGAKRLLEMNAIELPVGPSVYARSTSYLRRR
jgi:hypothetical protein